MKGWLFLAITICCEVCGTTCMKLSHTSNKWYVLALIPLFYGGTLTFMWLAFQSLEMGFVYAVWSGVGTAAAAVIGVAMFHESFSPLKFACIALIVVGVVGLNLASKPTPSPPTEGQDRVQESSLSD
jgi:small multidrug resistance pump